ncbi:MAG TPA: inner membrane CreD family protein [Sphingomicrobium sp.]
MRCSISCSASKPFSLLIGALLLFAALAGVMYATGRIDWSAKRSETQAASAA